MAYTANTDYTDTGAVADGTTLVIGPPGCGKTTHLGDVVRRAVEHGQKPLVCSLTRSAAAEVAGRGLPIPKQAVGTLHSHAYAALGAPDLVNGHLADWNASEPACGLRAGRSASMDDPFSGPGRDRELFGDRMLAAYDVLRSRCVARDAWPDSVAAFGRRWEAWKKSNQLMDFTDLIDQAVSRGVRAPEEPDVILVDEAQDHSRLELNLLGMWARRARSLVIVGDPWQALYVWRGAHPEMFTSSKVPADRRQLLSQSYRVPRAVHRLALRWVAQLSDFKPITYNPRDFDGFTKAIHTSRQRPEPVIELAMDHLARGRNVMICASCSYILANTVAVLRKIGLPFSNPWCTRRGDWNPLRVGRGVSMADRIQAFLRPITEKVDPVDDFPFGANVTTNTRRGWHLAELHRWAGAMRVKETLRTGAKTALSARAKGESAISWSPLSVNDLQTWFTPETCRFLEAMLDGRIETEEALGWYERRLTPEKTKPACFPLAVVRNRGVESLHQTPRLYVGTIHSFKGAEADIVIIYPDLSVNGMCAWRGSGTERDAVVRLFYVALTRAKIGVYLCRPISARSVKLWEAVK